MNRKVGRDSVRRTKERRRDSEDFISDRDPGDEHPSETDLRSEIGE